MKDVNKAAEDDDIELEDQYHDVDTMESVAAINFEADYLAKLVTTIKDKDERDFYADKIESLKFKKSTIESNIANQYVTLESYKAGVKGYLEKLEQVYKQANAKLGKANKHVQRLEGRLRAVMGELKGTQAGPTAQQADSKTDVVMKVGELFLII